MENYLSEEIRGQVLRLERAIDVGEADGRAVLALLEAPPELPILTTEEQASVDKRRLGKRRQGKPGSWGLTRWYANQIQSLIETRRALEFEIQEARQTIERIEETTWGVKLVEVDGRRFAILPESTPENPLLTMDGRPTVRLSSE